MYVYRGRVFLSDPLHMARVTLLLQAHDVLVQLGQLACAGTQSNRGHILRTRATQGEVDVAHLAMHAGGRVRHEDLMALHIVNLGLAIVYARFGVFSKWGNIPYFRLVPSVKICR